MRPFTTPTQPETTMKPQIDTHFVMNFGSCGCALLARDHSSGVYVLIAYAGRVYMMTPKQEVAFLRDFGRGEFAYVTRDKGRVVTVPVN